MKFWQTKSFIEEQKAWYQRLKDEGFEDAEELIKGELVLKQVAEHSYRGSDETKITAKERYFQLLKLYCNDFEFANEKDKAIMNMAADGMQKKANQRRA